MGALTQTTAKRNFVGVCRKVARDRRRAYVEEKAGHPYLTVDHVERQGTGPSVAVSAQFFKENFSRCSSLLRSGISFRVETTKPPLVVFVRRHTAYQDPLDGVVTRWRDLVVQEAAEGNILHTLRRLEGKVVSGESDILDAVRALAKGVARLAIGHRPFEEGAALMDENTAPAVAAAVPRRPEGERPAMNRIVMPRRSPVVAPTLRTVPRRVSR